MAAALAQELASLSISGASSLESLTAAAQKGQQAEPYLLAHLPAILKATADKVNPRRHLHTCSKRRGDAGELNQAVSRHAAALLAPRLSLPGS